MPSALRWGGRRRPRARGERRRLAAEPSASPRAAPCCLCELRPCANSLTRGPPITRTLYHADPLSRGRSITRRPPPPRFHVGGRWQWLASHLPTDQMQLLNLAHSWLAYVLPHILCKVARVHFGLLPERMIAEADAQRLPSGASPLPQQHPPSVSGGQPQDAAASAPSGAPSAPAGGGGGVTQSRRLLAVPFVGKDVPSHAAEFSHPDALIGQ